MTRVLKVALVASALSLLAQPGAFAASGDPQKRHSEKDTLFALSVLLKGSDLGNGWKAGSGAGATRQSCGIIVNVEPNLSRLVETARATGPLLSRGKTEAISQTARVFATPQQLTTAWARTVTKKFIICEEEQVEGASGMGSPVSVVDWSLLRLPHLVDHVYGLRIVATARIGQNQTWKNPSKVYFDVILLGHGRAMTKLVLSSLRRPFSGAYEQRLERIVTQAMTQNGG